ncbi:MAG: hypothetical protein LBC10_03810, partial [Deltaproteobacteria bacterium]|nr:hypothetical protein [Deltaproteobacteria bacterium]
KPLHVKGTAQIRRLSLPRWFAFARKLPSGIETALNNVSGELDFVLTPHDLTIPRLKALICGIPFAGVGGVSDFAKPNIHIAVQADTADVNAIFPELLRQSPKAIDWPAPPLVQQNDSRAGPDYDIRIAVAKAKIWKFAATQLALRCTPLPKGNRLHVAAKGFYDGSFVSTVDIEDRVAITAAFNQTMLDKPAAIVIDDSMLGGRLTGKATLHGSNQSFDHFLASLDGTVQGHITQGWLAKPGGKEKTLFGVMDFTFKAIGPGLAPPLPPLLSFAGDWKVSLRTATWEGSCTLNGALDLDSASLAFRRAHNVPGRLQWSDNGLTVNLEAQWDFDQAKDTLHIRNASGKLNGGAFSGSLAGSGISAASPQSPQWQGSLHLTTTALRPILQQHGLLPPDMPEESLQYLDIRGDFDLTGKTFQALGLKGKLDDTTFSGNIRHSSGDIRTWQADLTLGTLDLNRYLPSRPNATPNATPNVGQSPAQNPAPWPTTLLDDLSVRGTINLDSLTLAKLVQRSVRLPFVLENRVLTCKPIAFIPYNGRGEAELHVQASPAGYRTRLHYAAHNADAALFSREAGFKTILGGVATVKADVAGLLRQGKDIPAALDGSWSVAVTQGSIVEKQSGGSAAKPTPFRSISASGVMHQGILHTQDIDLKSNVIAAKGNARINLVDWTLNCRLNVSTQSFSDVPVVYAGSLDAPERSINALHAVTGAIGKLGSGLYGLVEDVLSTPFRLLR